MRRLNGSLGFLRAWLLLRTSNRTHDDLRARFNPNRTVDAQVIEVAIIWIATIVFLRIVTAHGVHAVH